MKPLIQTMNAMWCIVLFTLFWVKNDSNADVCSTIFGAFSLVYLATIATVAFHSVE